MILKPGSEEKARSIFDKWDLDFAIIGEVTNTGRLVLTKDGFEACNLPLEPLVEDAPEYDKLYEIKTEKKIFKPSNLKINLTIIDILKIIFKNPNIASKKWIWEQYDSSVMGDTIFANGDSDASVIKIHGTEKKESYGKGLAITTDCTPRYVKSDPIIGGMQAVCEAARNIACSGAKPLAITNNLNFGNPDKKNVMGEIVGSIKGISEAASFLSTPIVSGNVSLYNETNGESILPTPVIGMVGVIDKVENSLEISAKLDNVLIALGQSNNFETGWVGCSIYQETVHKKYDGAPPPINLKNEKKVIEILLKLNEQKLLTAAHDISDGGLLTTVCEMLFKYNLGLDINLPSNLINYDSYDPLLQSWCFGEDQARIIVATKDTKKVELILKENNVDFFVLGKTNSSSNLNLKDIATISIQEINEINEKTIPNMMGKEQKG